MSEIRMEAALPTATEIPLPRSLNVPLRPFVVPPVTKSISLDGTFADVGKAATHRDTKTPAHLSVPTPSTLLPPGWTSSFSRAVRFIPEVAP